MSNNDSDVPHQPTRNKNQSSWAPAATQSRSGRTIKPKIYDDYQKPGKQTSVRNVSSSELRNGGLAGSVSHGSIVSANEHVLASNTSSTKDRPTENTNFVAASGRKRPVLLSRHSAQNALAASPSTNVDIPAGFSMPNSADAVDSQHLSHSSDAAEALPSVTAAVDNVEGGLKFRIRLPNMSRPEDVTGMNAPVMAAESVQESGDDYSSAQEDSAEDHSAGDTTSSAATDAESTPRAQSSMSDGRQDTTVTGGSQHPYFSGGNSSAHSTGVSTTNTEIPMQHAPPHHLYTQLSVPEPPTGMVSSVAAVPPTSAPPVNTRTKREIKAPKFFDDRMTEMAERHRKPVKLKLKLPKMTETVVGQTTGLDTTSNVDFPGTAHDERGNSRKKKSVTTALESNDSSSFATPSEEGSLEGGLAATADSRKSRDSTKKRRSDRQNRVAQERLSDDDDDDGNESSVSPDRRNSHYHQTAAHHRTNESSFNAANSAVDDPFGDFGLLTESPTRDMQLNYGSNPLGGRADVSRHNPYHGQGRSVAGRSTAMDGVSHHTSQADFIHQALSWASTSHSTAASTALPSSSASSTSVHDQIVRNIGPPPPFQRADVNAAAARPIRSSLNSHSPPPPVSSSTSSTANVADHQQQQQQQQQMQPHDEAAVRLQEMTQIIAAESGDLLGNTALRTVEADNRMNSVQPGSSNGDMLVNAGDGGGVGTTSESGVDHVPTEQELQEALNEVMAEMENSGYDFLNQLSGGPQMDGLLSGGPPNPQHAGAETGEGTVSLSQGETVSSGVVAPVVATTTVGGVAPSLVSTLAPGMLPASGGLVGPVTTNVSHHAAAMRQPLAPPWNVVGTPGPLTASNNGAAGGMVQHSLLSQYGNLIPSSGTLRLGIPAPHHHHGIGMGITPTGITGQLPPYGGVSFVMAPPASHTHNMYSGGGMTSTLNATSSTTSLMDEDGGGRLAIDMGEENSHKPNGAYHHQNMLNKVSSGRQQQQQQQQHAHVQQHRVVENDGGEAAYQREVDAEREEYANQEGGDLDPFGYDDGGADSSQQHSSGHKSSQPRYAKRGPYNKRKSAVHPSDANYMDNAAAAAGATDTNDLSRDGVNDDSYGDYVDDGSGPNLEQLAVMLDTLPDADRIVARMILLDDVPPEQVRMLARQLDSDRLAREMNGEGILRQQAEEMRAKRRQNISGAMMYADAKFEEVQQHNRDTNQTTAQTKIANELKDAYNKLTPDQQAPYELMAQEVRQGVRELPARVLRNFHYLTGIGMLEHLSNRVYAVDRQHVVKMWRKITKKSRHALAELAHVIEEALDKFLAEEDALGYQQQREQSGNAAAASDAATNHTQYAGAPPITSGGAAKPFSSSQEILRDSTTTASSVAVPSATAEADARRQAAAAALLTPKRSATPQSSAVKKEAGAVQHAKGTPAGPTGGANAASKPPVDKPKPAERPRGVMLLNLDERVNEQRGFNKLQAAYRDGATGSRDNTVPCSLACGAHFPVQAPSTTTAANAVSSSGVTTTSDDSGIAHMDEVDSEAEFEDTAASQWVTHPFEPHAMPLPANVPLNAADECKPTALAYAGLFQHAAHRTQQVASSLAVEQQKAFEHLGSSRSYRSRNSSTATVNTAKPERKLHIANEHLIDSILNASCSIFAGALAQISGTDPNTGVPSMKFMANGSINGNHHSTGTVAEKQVDDDEAVEKIQQVHKQTLENQGDCILASVETMHAVMGSEVKPDSLRATRVLAAHREADRKREAQERAAAVAYAQQHGISEHALNRNGQRTAPPKMMMNGRNAPYSQLITPGHYGPSGMNVIRSGGAGRQHLFNSNNKGIDGASGNKRPAADYARFATGSKRPRYTITADDDSDDYDDYADDADYKGPSGRRLHGARGGSSQIDDEYTTDEDEMADIEDETGRQRYGMWRQKQDERVRKQNNNTTPNRQQQQRGPNAPRHRTSFLVQQGADSSNKGRNYLLSKTSDDEMMEEGGVGTPSRVYLSGTNKNHSGMIPRNRLSSSSGNAPSSQYLGRQNVSFSTDKSQSGTPQGPGVAFSRTPRTTVLLQRGFLGSLPPSSANAAGASTGGAQQRPKADTMSKTGADITSPAEMMMDTTSDSSAVPLPAPVANVEYMARPAPVLPPQQQQLSRGGDEDQQYDENEPAEEYADDEYEDADRLDTFANSSKAQNVKKMPQKVTIPSLTSSYVLAKHQSKKLAPASSQAVQPQRHTQSIMFSQGAGQPPRLFNETVVLAPPPTGKAEKPVKGFSASKPTAAATPKPSIFGVRKPTLPPHANPATTGKAAAARATVFGGPVKSTKPVTVGQAKQQQSFAAQTKPAIVLPRLNQNQQQQQRGRPAGRDEFRNDYDELRDEYEDEASGYSDDYEYDDEADDAERFENSNEIDSRQESFALNDDEIEVDEDYAGSPSAPEDDDVGHGENDDHDEDDAVNDDDYGNNQNTRPWYTVPSNPKKGAASVSQPRASNQPSRIQASFGFVMEPPATSAARSQQRSQVFGQARPAPGRALPSATRSQVFTPNRGVFTQKPSQATPLMFGSRPRR